MWLSHDSHLGWALQSLLLWVCCMPWQTICPSTASCLTGWNCCLGRARGGRWKQGKEATVTATCHKQLGFSSGTYLCHCDIGFIRLHLATSCGQRRGEGRVNDTTSYCSKQSYPLSTYPSFPTVSVCPVCASCTFPCVQSCAISQTWETSTYHMWKRGKGGSKGKDEERKGRREEERKRGRKGGREEGRKGGREEERKGGREEEGSTKTQKPWVYWFVWCTLSRNILTRM